MKKSFLVVVLLWLIGAVSAQHCGFDNTYLLGIRPFAGDSANIIKGLSIQLVDQYQRPLNLRSTPVCKQNKTTSFRTNGKPTPYQDIQYYFAKKDYVFVGGQDAWQVQPAYIKIEDTVGLNGGLKFETRLIPYSRLNFIHLCSYSSNYEQDKFKAYRPVWVDLNGPNRTIKQEITEKKPFIFLLDRNPENVNVCEALGCYAARLQVYASWSNAILFDTLLQGIMNPDLCRNIYSTADYNFDGYPDFKLCTGGEHYQAYYLYDQQKNSFYPDSLLSSFYSIVFDTLTKSATGYSAILPHSGDNYPNEQLIYHMSGERLSVVRVEKSLTGSPEWHPKYQVADSFLYVNKKRKAMPQTAFLPNTKVLYINGWRVERHIDKYFGPETTEIKPPGYKPREVSTAIYRIYNVSDEKLLLQTGGEYYPDFKPEYVKEPIMKDVDFDGIPELWIPKQFEEGSYFYYGYTASKRTFEQLFISQLIDLKINKENQTATGYRLIRSNAGGPPLYKTHYVLKGKGLPIVKETNEPLPQPKPTPPPFNPVIFSQTVGQYRYELRTIEPTDAVKIPLDKGAYAQKVMIFSLKDQQEIARFYLHGNQIQEQFRERKSLEIKYMNFDAVADIVVPSMDPIRPATVYLSCTSDENVWFYLDQYLSKSMKVESNLTDKILSGTYTEGHESFFFQYNYLTAPSLYITRQNTINPTTAMRAIYKNECGQLITVSGSLVPPIKAAPKREFADYNFDGHEDFRVACDSFPNDSRAECWNYFIYNSATKDFEFHEVLSNATSVQFMPATKTLIATITEREGLTTVSTTYSMQDGRVQPANRNSCTQKFNHSERSDCTLEKWENGVWVFVDFIQGAE